MVGLLPLVAAALMLAWGHQAVRHAAAQVPAPGMDLSMAVEGVAGCDTTGGNAVCYLAPGSDFTVDFSLNSLPNGYTGYSGFDVNITYTGVTTSGEPTSTEWPDCGYPAHLHTPGVSVRWGCAIGLDTSPSMYTGLLSTLGFSCTDAESSGNKITMQNGGLATSINFNGEPAAENEGTEELTINCGARPSPTSPSAAAGATPTALPITGNAPGLSGGNSTNTGLWVIIGLLAAAAVGATSILGWRVTRSR
jgi:hypothetical protein